MSSAATTNLEDGYSLPTSLPRIRAPPPSSASDNSTGVAPNDGDAVECRTPTSSDHRIPAQLACPPAPRKPSRAVKRKRATSPPPPCQKKVSEEEIESFFRSCEVKKPTGAAGGFRVVAKRTCSCK